MAIVRKMPPGLARDVARRRRGRNESGGCHRRSAASLVRPHLQVERVKAVREARGDVPIVLNARTDVYLLETGRREKRYDAALRRLAAFRDAGADCVFVPGLAIRNHRTPGEGLAVSGKHPGRTGISVRSRAGEAGRGPGQRGICPMRATLGLLRQMAEELKTTGTYGALEGDPLCGREPHDDVNRRCIS